MGNFGLTFVPCNSCKNGKVERLIAIEFDSGITVPAREIPVEFRKAILENSPALSIAGSPVFADEDCPKCLGSREYAVEYVACAIF
jgi:hypothetical protein